MVLDKLFGWSKKQEEEPQIHFGRYSDNNKTVYQVAEWTEADLLFREKEYYKSIEKIFAYLTDPREENVILESNSDGFNFQLYQGSKLVRGQINTSRFAAEVQLAKLDKPAVPVMRRLLEMNFNLYYSRYSLRDGIIYMKFDCDLSSASPNKVYYGLKELATKADKQDDLLLDEFKSLSPIDHDHVIPLADAEKEIKFRYLRQWIETSLHIVDSLDQEKFSGGISYLLLSLVFRIDYLTLPEGKLLQDLEKIASAYYGKEDKTAPERNPLMIEGFKKLLGKTNEELAIHFFRSRHSFAIVAPGTHKTVTDAIETSLENMKWYRDNNYPEIALKVMEYGFAYCQYSYSLPSPLSQLFKLFMNINYQDYFSDLGFRVKYYDESKNEFFRDDIEDAIMGVINSWTPKYPSLNFNTRELEYATQIDFNESFLKEIAQMDFD